MFEHKVSEELYIRMFTEDDAEEFYQLIEQSRDYLKEWMGWVESVQVVEDTKRNIQARIHSLLETGGYPKSFAIIFKGEIVGTLGYNTIDESNRIGTIGYWLGKSYQGQGLMTQVLKTVISYGFKELRLNRVEIRVAVENEKSRALPQRLGFQEEGIIRQAEWLHDHFVDHVIYGMLVDEWK